MRLSLNKEQWDKLCECSDSISAMPVTVGNLLQHFTVTIPKRNFNIAYDAERKVFGVWYDDMFEKFEDKELINAMFNMFCYLEEI